MHQKEMKSQKVASYVGKITFLGHCCEESRIKRPRIDLSDVLSDASSLDAMIKDLFLPFEAAMVDQIVAITPKWISSQKQKETQEEKNRFTSTIAAAMAGVKGLGT
jgi:hypothetical protein